MTTKWDVVRFVLRKVPSILWFGIRFKELTRDKCVVTLRKNWRNRNPHGTAYFAAVAAAGEMAAGIMIFKELQLYEGKIVPIIHTVNARFTRAVEGDTTFTCEDGQSITYHVRQAVRSGSRGVVTTTTARNARGKLVAEIELGWHIKRISK